MTSKFSSGQSHSTRSAGRSAGQAKDVKESKTTRHEARLTVPPLARSPVGRVQGVAATVKTIIVQDQTGKIVSVTRVAPDARFGVGVKAKPGHTVREVEAGSLADSTMQSSGAPSDQPD